MKKVTAVKFVASDGKEFDAPKEVVAYELRTMAHIPPAEEGKRATSALGDRGVAFIIDNAKQITALLAELEPELPMEAGAKSKAA
jgi:hypothetical protein